MNWICDKSNTKIPIIKIIFAFVQYWQVLTVFLLISARSLIKSLIDIAFLLHTSAPFQLLSILVILYKKWEKEEIREGKKRIQEKNYFYTPFFGITAKKFGNSMHMTDYSFQNRGGRWFGRGRWSGGFSYNETLSSKKYQAGIVLDSEL